jgi:hypothetical protein
MLSELLIAFRLLETIPELLFRMKIRENFNFSLLLLGTSREIFS